ncbi:MAG TPA: hypothetical protein VIG24_04025 [Acidimicrobiia bacterium]
MRPQLELVGYRQLKKELRQLGDEAVASLKQTNKEAADLVADTARPDIPVRSGRLKGTLRTTGTMRGGVVRMGRKAVPYAGPIHFGWPNRPNQAKGWRGGPIAPNPFLYEAMDERVQDVMDLYSKYLETLPTSRKLGYRTTKRP